MLLEKLLSQQKAAILQRWFKLIAETHPAGVSGFAKETDRFTNPVGYTISREIESLYEELLQGRGSSEEASASLDSILKINAVQDCSPPQAIAFVFLLKQAVREQLGSEIAKRQLLGQWLDVESRIDELACLAFDIYMKCRERIYELRVREVKAERERAFRLLELAGRVSRNQGEVME